MKYLVNKETKEHIVFHADLSVPYPQWGIVEADSEGWIPWNGGECPLPDDCECQIQTKEGDRILARAAKRWTWALNIGDATITHYLPILAEKEEPRRHGRTIVHIPESQQSVFDRLKSAIAASESIPAIIAEIDAMLPEGYRVVKCGVDWAKGYKPEEQSANDMSDWRNWREGDLVTAHGLRGGYTENAFPENVPHTIVAKCLSGFNVKSSNGDVLYFNGREISRGELKFHSHPAKVTE